MSACVICGKCGTAIIASSVTKKSVCDECAMRFLYWIERNADVIRTALGIDNLATSNGPRCQICGEIQSVTPYGANCPNGHKDAAGVDVKDVKAT